MDEFHYYAEPDRGWAWQVPLLELPQAQFVLMSATLGDVDPLRGRPDPPHRPADRRGRARRAAGAAALLATRSTPLHETLEELLETQQAPVYVVHFTQAAALERAQALMSINVASRAEKDAIAELIGGFRFAAGFGKTLSRLVRHGIGVHHAGMLPQVPAARRAARPGRPAQGHLRHRHPRRRHQRADPHGRAVHRAEQVRRHPAAAAARPASSTRSRAARAGPATTRPGTVVVQAPEHVIENERPLAKAGDDPKKRRKVVSARRRRRASCRGAEQTFERLVARRARAADLAAAGRATRCCSTSSPARRRRSR